PPFGRRPLAPVACFQSLSRAQCLCHFATLKATSANGLTHYSGTLKARYFPRNCPRNVPWSNKNFVLLSPRYDMLEVRSLLSCVISRKGDQHEVLSAYHTPASRAKSGGDWHLGTELAPGASATRCPFCAPGNPP